MKRIIPFFLLLWLAAGVIAEDVGMLTVSVLSSMISTGITEIEYDSSPLDGICAEYDISIKVRFFEEENFHPIPDDDLVGELTNVAPGFTR